MVISELSIAIINFDYINMDSNKRIMDHQE